MWTLPDLQNLTKTQQIHVEHLKKNATPLTLQKKAIQQTAESYGAQGGLAWRAKQIDDKLEGLVPQLDSVYNFSHLALPLRYAPLAVRSLAPPIKSRGPGPCSMKRMPPCILPYSRCSPSCPES